MCTSALYNIIPDVYSDGPATPVHYKIKNKLYLMHITFTVVVNKKN